MLLTCDGDRHVYRWAGADTLSAPAGTPCVCGKTVKGETLQTQIADLTARLDQAQAMILERDQRIAELEGDCIGYRHVAETEADYSAELDAKLKAFEAALGMIDGVAQVATIESSECVDFVRMPESSFKAIVNGFASLIRQRDQRIAELTASLAGRYDLKALEVCADAATFEAETQIERFEGEAINWGDLGCVGAEWYVGADDSTGYRVWIEEADPAAYRLRDFIREHLARHGFVDVDVMLEW